MVMMKKTRQNSPVYKKIVELARLNPGHDIVMHIEQYVDVNYEAFWTKHGGLLDPVGQRELFWVGYYCWIPKYDVRILINKVLSRKGHYFVISREDGEVCTRFECLARRMQCEQCGTKLTFLNDKASLYHGMTCEQVIMSSALS